MRNTDSIIIIFDLASKEQLHDFTGYPSNYLEGQLLSVNIENKAKQVFDVKDEERVYRILKVEHEFHKTYYGNTCITRQCTHIYVKEESNG